jgi:hypothetical protein
MEEGRRNKGESGGREREREIESGGEHGAVGWWGSGERNEEENPNFGFYMSPGLTEVGNIKAVELGQPPWLVGVNRGGSFTLPASIKH